VAGGRHSGIERSALVAHDAREVIAQREVQALYCCDHRVALARPAIHVRFSTRTRPGPTSARYLKKPPEKVWFRKVSAGCFSKRAPLIFPVKGGQAVARPRQVIAIAGGEPAFAAREPEDGGG
jgi:hypothetical protein